MRGLRLLFVVAAAAMLPLIGADAAPKKRAGKPAAVVRDWTRLVVATPEGGFRMGNPNAKVKLVEYGSLTCPHCRHFATTSAAPLAASVRSGKVSYEFRNMVLNGIDMAATLVARCGGTRSFFPTVSDLYGTQPVWVGRAGRMTDAEKQELNGLSDAQRLARIARIAGIVQIGARHGIAPAAASRCLSDPSALNRLGKMYEAAMARGVDSTPTFFINGEIARVDDWAAIEPLLKKAGG
ncbi:MAG: thioredoxin domain-containing protein [Sphingomicrobium sp.]